MEKSPILGYGPSTGASKIGYLGNSNSLTIDNYYLSMVIESGIPGLLLYIAMLLVPLLRIFQFVDRERAGLLAALVSSVMVFATIRSILSLTHNQDFALLIIAMLMILGCLPKKQQAKRSDSMDDKTNSIETGFISTLSEL